MRAAALGRPGNRGAAGGRARSRRLRARTQGDRAARDTVAACPNRERGRRQCRGHQAGAPGGTRVHQAAAAGMGGACQVRGAHREAGRVVTGTGHRRPGAVGPPGGFASAGQRGRSGAGSRRAGRRGLAVGGAGCPACWPASSRSLAAGPTGRTGSYGRQPRSDIADPWLCVRGPGTRRRCCGRRAATCAVPTRQSARPCGSSTSITPRSPRRTCAPTPQRAGWTRPHSGCGWRCVTAVRLKCSLPPSEAVPAIC